MIDKLQQQEERIKFQDQCVSLSLENKHLLIQAATGVGKGLAAIKAIEASPSFKSWLVVVPEILQIKNFKDDLELHGYEELLGTKIIDVICYASLEKWKNCTVNLMLNEVHKLTDLRSDIVNTIKFDQIISDSATVSGEIEAKLYDICPFYKYGLSLDEAIERGILPPPTIHIINIELNDTIKRNPTKFAKTTYKLTDLGKSQWYDKQVKYWLKRYEEDDEEWMKNKVIRFGGERKKFLAHLKTPAAKKLLTELKGKRLICFTGSTEQCDELGGEYAVHSKKTKKHNAAVIEGFNNGTINEAYFNKMAREGMNFTGIEVGVSVQLDSGNDEGLSFLQKTGRAMRADDPHIYILIAKDTHDEKFLKKALENIDEKYIVYGD